MVEEQQLSSHSFQPRTILFVAEGDQGIYTQGAACGDVSRKSGHSGESKRDSCECGRVMSRDAEQHVPEETRGRKRAGYSNGQARQC